MPVPARILWTNAVTLGSVAVLVGTELRGGGAGWAIGGAVPARGHADARAGGRADPVRADGALFLSARRAWARADPGLRGCRRSLLPLAGEGGATGRRKTPVFRRAMAPDEGLFSTESRPRPHPSPLPRSGKGGLDADVSKVTSGAFRDKLRPDCANLRDAWSLMSGLTSE